MIAESRRSVSDAMLGSRLRVRPRQAAKGGTDMLIDVNYWAVVIMALIIGVWPPAGTI